MFTKVFLLALLERVLRGAAAGVSAGFLAGDVVFNTFDVNTWADIGALALGGAFSALVLSIVGQATTGNGPALTKQETTEPHV
jgi:hypothetical protein